MGSTDDELAEEIDVYINNITWSQLLSPNHLSKTLNTSDLSQLGSRVLSNTTLLQFPLERGKRDIFNNVSIEVYSEERTQFTFFSPDKTNNELNIRIRNDSMHLSQKSLSHRNLSQKSDSQFPYKGWMESDNVTCDQGTDCLGTYVNYNNKKVLVLTPLSAILQLRPSFKPPDNPSTWKPVKVHQPESQEGRELLKLLKTPYPSKLYFKRSTKDYLDYLTIKTTKPFPLNISFISSLSPFDQLFLLFNKFEVVSNELISQHLNLDPYNTENAESIDYLQEVADLIDGNWVLKSKYCFTELDEQNSKYLRLCRDLLLSLLYRQSQQEISKSSAGGLDIEPFQKATGLPVEFVKYLIERLAVQISSCWFLPYPRDDKFIELHPKLAANSHKYWNNRLSESAIEIENINKNKFKLDDICSTITCYLRHSSPKSVEEIFNVLRTRSPHLLSSQHDNKTWMDSINKVAIDLGDDSWFLRSNKKNNFIKSRESLLNFLSTSNKTTYSKSELESITGALPDIVFRKLVSEFLIISDTFKLKRSTPHIKSELDMQTDDVSVHNFE